MQCPSCFTLTDQDRCPRDLQKYFVIQAQMVGPCARQCAQQHFQGFWVAATRHSPMSAGGLQRVFLWALVNSASLLVGSVLWAPTIYIYMYIYIWYIIGMYWGPDKGPILEAHRKALGVSGSSYELWSMSWILQPYRGLT